ncbi:hypothetical protein GCM10010124_16130 [Pilimelia terevasa]|uniref:Carboxypeptidase regulatory-like domain-containing protein n=1 Tax=Pilimelia terevasa TaxID=53372 RepID=A0A8J3FGE3_9ACTN|nr:carboxypeptidase-like regulatory domain-containing protein [Pilimelia terevasa]GGK24385.1 hypothetical protein GCM10010124_16130 [Pilimelia terevasa]
MVTLAAVVAAAALCLPTAGSAAVPEGTGVISGRVVLSNGSPAEDIPVVVHRAGDHRVLASVRTDGDGAYRNAGLAPGAYAVGARRQFRGEEAIQWAPGRWLQAQADTVLVTADTVVTVDQQLLARPATAALRGRLQVRGGVPPNFLEVSWHAGRTPVRADGSYRIEGALPGDDRISIAVRRGMGWGRWWGPGADHPDDGERVSVDAGASGVAPDLVVAVGTVAGRVTGPDGRPAQSVEVSMHQRGSRGLTYSLTDADGGFSFDAVKPGEYQFSTYARLGTPIQWFPRKSSPEAGAHYQVEAGRTLTLHEQLLLPTERNRR